MNVKAWKRRLEAERQEKDRFFALHPQSPIPSDGRGGFAGLRYFPPDPGYRFELELQRHDDPDTVTVEDTSGKIREMIRVGEFCFTVQGKDCKLQAYQRDPLEERLFVPFRDQTSGQETCGAGRYLDLEPEKNLTADGTWIVDFNTAYNPWCAYSQNYVCPFVLPENWLEVPIRAGEKGYGSGEH